jgi:hypothetical protein
LTVTLTIFYLFFWGGLTKNHFAYLSEQIKKLLSCCLVSFGDNKI